MAKKRRPNNTIYCKYHKRDIRLVGECFMDTQCFKTCKVPFFTAEIFDNGDVYSCCPDYTKIGAIGNIYKQSWNEIWNSENAKKIRSYILNGNYSLCRLNYCNGNFFPLVHELQTLNTEVNFQEYKPKIIKFSTDNSCNVMCTICRNKLHCNDDVEHTKFLDSKIESIFIPILKDVEIVNFTGSGDPFASKHFRKLIKRIAEVYPNIKFDLHTNGILCNEQNLTDLGIINRLSTVQISLHSATKETYNKIVKNGNWDKVENNIKFLNELKRKNLLNEIHLNFVITSVNYRDIPLFIDFCAKYNAKGFLWNYRDMLSNVLDIDDTIITSPLHNEHSDFVKIMTSEQVKSAKNIYMSPLIENFSKIKDVNDYLVYSSIITSNISERYDMINKKEIRKFTKLMDIYNINQNDENLHDIKSSKFHNFPIAFSRNSEHLKIEILGIKFKFRIK